VTRIPPMSLFCTCFSSGRITRLYAWTQLRNSNEPKVDFVRNIDFDQSNGFRTICINASTSGHRLCSRHYTYPSHPHYGCQMTITPKRQENIGGTKCPK